MCDALELFKKVSYLSNVGYVPTPQLFNVLVFCLRVMPFSGL